MSKKIDYIITYTGIMINPAKIVSKDDLHLEDIAHALSNQCRFSGHVKQFYSVASHSLLVSELAESVDKRAALAGLLHDAAEAYVIDVPNPIKQNEEMRWYRNNENKILKVIFEKYNVTNTKAIMDIVKEADVEALKREVSSLMPKHNGFDHLNMEPELYVKVVPESPYIAKKRFKERFYQVIKYDR
jgi:5'-deoxynucleotidase YfbR-like HD superfamily hydrolase